MTNSKMTRRALLTSVMALFLCFAMLTGTTFAWFTDQETSANNRIVAGNLDVDLLMYNGTSYVSIANANGDIFKTGATANNSNATLWEPGKTQVAYLRIENKGNLDLKYQVSLKVDNVAHDLYEVMEYAIVPNAASGTGVSQWNGGNKVVVGTQLVATETTLAAGTYHDFALAIHMLEEAGNKYKNGEVSFDITVEATQLASEFDSFGNDYDVDSPFITKTTLNIPTDKITNGAITEDMMIGSETGNAYAELTAGTKLADGATALTLSTSKADANTGDDLYAGEVYGFDFSIDGLAGDNTEPVTVTKKAALPTGLTNVVGYHKGTLFTDFTYDPATGDVTVTVATFCNFTFVACEKLENVSDGLYKDSSDVYYVYNANGLETLNKKLAIAKTKISEIQLMNNIDFTGKTWTTVDNHADTITGYLSSINGNGYTISNLTINGQAMFSRFAGIYGMTIKDLTFDNATVNSNGTINTSILTVQCYKNVLLDNVDVKNSTIIGGYKVAPLIATVYNESSSSITATLKNCDVSNTTVTATAYDFCTTGMVAFVYADDNDKIVFENCTITDVALYAPNVYTAHAAVYTTGSSTLFNEVEGVTVNNVTFENK